MAQQIPKNSVWSAMSYVPPRGRCNYKTSLMSPSCPCLRFMLHPVKAATSFECDGCNHHASFHSLENNAEDTVLKKWVEREADNRKEKQAIAGSSKKRKRIAEKAAEPMPGIFEVVELSDGELDTESEEAIKAHLMTAHGIPESELGPTRKSKSGKTGRKPREYGLEVVEST